MAERWFGGPSFESWIGQHAELEPELRRLHEEWLAELDDLYRPGPGAEHGARSAASFRAGELLGGFRLRERLGSGTSGEVWMADELALGRAVALKLLRPDIALDPRARERFRREALAEARIRHPGVVKVYSIGRAQGQAYIAQELVEGGRTLAAWIQEARNGAPPGPEHFRLAAEWMAQAAEALGAAHEQGIYHRDIKPQNLLLTPDGRVKVADFGLAHLAGEFSISQVGDVVGTVPYMSPSQVCGQLDQLDGRSDEFSLGATVYEVVTLERAFPGKSLAEIAHRVLHEDPVAPRRIQPRLPEDLEAILLRTLDKEPDERYPSMGELAADLRRFLSGEPLLARSRSLRGRLRRWRRRHPTLAAATLLALLASGAIAWQIRDRGQRERLRIEAQIHSLEARAQLEIELGDIEAARQLVAEADALAGGDPTGHLVLAGGYMRLGRMPESEREIQLACERGFETDPLRLETAMQHAGYALYLASRRDFSLYPEAERHIDRALQLDPDLYALQFQRYLLREAVGDQAGAREALLAFQRRIPPGDSQYLVVEALRLEGESEPAQALALLESMASGLSEERLTELRWHRNAGRLCLRLGDLERAEALLLRAVADAPMDCWSWDALGVVYQKRLQAGAADPAVREAAQRYSDEARECSPSLPNPNYVQAYLAEWELGQAGAGEASRDHPAWKRAREALDRLHALGAGDAEATRRLEAHLCLLDALPHYGRGERHEAQELLARAAERDPDNLQAVAMLGECLYWTGQPLRGLAVLEGGLARWDDPAAACDRNPQWLGMLLAWSLANAGLAPDRVAFQRACERLERELGRGVSFPKVELINAAEYLATAPQDFRACDLAWRIVDEHGLESSFEGTPVEEEARQILKRIAAECP